VLCSVVNIYLYIYNKFPDNACSGWLKHRAISKNRVRVDDVKLAFQFLFRNFDKCDQRPRSIFSE